MLMNLVNGTFFRVIIYVFTEINNLLLYEIENC